MPTTSISTTLLESVNIVLANLGESPVNTLSGGALPQQVSLALNTIEEVSTDIQSKGWWFNQKSGSSYSTTANVVIYPSNTGNNWGSDIPEEARRYITIRASRIAQTRLIGSEELQKFSYNEELISLAILQQAHVRNSNGALDFNSFPSELRGLGIDEVMFLQGNVEEKIGTLRLGGELANTAKTKADTDLVEAQEELVDQQKLTEVHETAKRANEASLVEAQEELTDAQKTQSLTESILRSQQALTELEETAKRTSEKLLVDEQAGLVTNQAATELKKALDLVADTTLKGKQGSLIDAQRTTENEQAQKVAAETDLTGKQSELTEAQTSGVLTDSLLKSQQALTELENTAKVAAETSLLGEQEDLVEAQALDVAADTTLKGNQSALIASQKTQLDAQTAIEATAEKAFYDGVVAGTQDTYRDYAAEMRIMGVQETTFQQTPAYKKVEILKDAAKLRLVTATETGTDATELLEVNKVMRFIGEPPVTALNDNSLASECVRLMRDTDTELQGRGWYFNIDEDGAIVPKSLSDTPQKYREYLSVRVAILLTELYPQSGVDIQRLPKMEAELRAYFKDREFDDANYSIFDSYDVASRIGINRNYDLI